MRRNRHNRQSHRQQSRQHADALAQRIALVFVFVMNFQFRHATIVALPPNHESWMLQALAMARSAEAAEEAPVGAVVVIHDEIVGRGANAPIARHDPTAHAEILALRDAAQRLGNYRLPGATLYCTLEPCVMCAGALVAARVERLVFGARDLRFGGVRSKFQIADSPLLNHSLEIVEGVLAVECVELLKRFFEARR